MNQVSEFDPATSGKIPEGKNGTESPAGGDSSIWEIRTQERPYAFLDDKDIKTENRYGNKIDLLEVNPGWEEGQSLLINDNPEVGCNPNRNKQHGFFFTADNCIGCHACEAACSEKNDNPGHIAFRSVGYVEGGCYPDYQRMNISMACNHCDDPVCLKGCPTGAYIKHTEYGAVLQDPETCFGCGYCTWVCPYNAPQLDPVQGQVSKCNMCVDRLEVGLKPACVSACLGNALDFGVVENIPENREEALSTIPGFPDPSITQPNIRFQQSKRMPEEVSRTDSTPLKYHRDNTGQYKPIVDPKDGLARKWSLKKLSSRENPLVMFTLFSQMAIGAFSIAFIGALMGNEEMLFFQQSDGYVPLVFASCLLVALGLFFSTTHLGKPMRFYRGFNNLKFSPVCREGLGLALFITFAGLNMLCSLPANTLFASLFESATGFSLDTELGKSTATVFGLAALLSGAGGLFYMIKCYRIKARPFWDHWNVATDFTGNAVALGSYLAGSMMLIGFAFSGEELQTLHEASRILLSLGLIIMLTGMKAHASAMHGAEHEGAASYYIQSTVFGKTQTMRWVLMITNLLFSIGVLFFDMSNVIIFSCWVISGLALIISQLTGRALFYILVVPTTMPGAFFWKNKGFEQHARDIGLADMPQLGLAPDKH